MGSPKAPAPAKYLIALLTSEIALLDAVETELSELLGPVDARGEILPWTVSRYYEQEMGTNLIRRFLSFAPLLPPERLADIKLATQRLEEKYRRGPGSGGGRRVNIDPGYIEAGKLVLASTKNASHRIYLRDGIYAEATLQYHDGGFHGASHTYADYLWPATRSFLEACRARYLAQLRHRDSASVTGQGPGTPVR